jgi:hypothetical protein
MMVRNPTEVVDRHQFLGQRRYDTGVSVKRNGL